MVFDEMGVKMSSSLARICEYIPHLTHMVYLPQDQWYSADFSGQVRDWCLMQKWTYWSDWIRDPDQDDDRLVAFRFRTRDQATWFQLRWR
jgi:hypothetical protein